MQHAVLQALTEVVQRWPGLSLALVRRGFVYVFVLPLPASDESHVYMHCKCSPVAGTGPTRAKTSDLVYYQVGGKGERRRLLCAKPQKVSRKLHK